MSDEKYYQQRDQEEGEGLGNYDEDLRLSSLARRQTGDDIAAESADDEERKALLPFDHKATVRKMSEASHRLYEIAHKMPKPELNAMPDSIAKKIASFLDDRGRESWQTTSRHFYGSTPRIQPQTFFHTRRYFNQATTTIKRNCCDNEWVDTPFPLTRTLVINERCELPDKLHFDYCGIHIVAYCIVALIMPPLDIFFHCSSGCCAPTLCYSFIGTLADMKNWICPVQRPDEPVNGYVALLPPPPRQQMRDESRVQDEIEENNQQDLHN